MNTERSPNVVVDVVGETCPIPLVEMRKAVMKAEKGHVIEVIGTHGPSKEEIPMAVGNLGLKLLGVEDDAEGRWHIFIQN